MCVCVCVCDAICMERVTTALEVHMLHEFCQRQPRLLAAAMSVACYLSIAVCKACRAVIARGPILS